MYNTHNLEDYNRVIELRKKFGWGSTKISSFLLKQGLNIKKGVIDGWIYYNKRPFQEVIIHKIPEKSRLLTKEKAYLLGVLCGDGYIRIHKSGHGFLVGLNVCDEDFADEFVKCLKEVYTLPPSKKFRKYRATNFCENPKSQFAVNLTSKLVVYDLLRYSKSFKTKEWKIPKQILESSLEIKSNFLKGLFDSEGTIRLKRKGHAYLQICSGNNCSLLKVRDLLKKDFDIDLKIGYNNVNVMVLYSENYKNIKNYYNKIGFSIKRKQEKLLYCLSTYKRKGLRKYNKEFKLKVLGLLKEGYSTREIGKMLNFNYTNIYDFIKQDKRDNVPAGI